MIHEISEIISVSQAPLPRDWERMVRHSYFSGATWLRLAPNGFGERSLTRETAPKSGSSPLKDER